MTTKPIRDSFAEDQRQWFGPDSPKKTRLQTSSKSAFASLKKFFCDKNFSRCLTISFFVVTVVMGSLLAAGNLSHLSWGVISAIYVSSVLGGGAFLRAGHLCSQKEEKPQGKRPSYWGVCIKDLEEFHSKYWDKDSEL